MCGKYFQMYILKVKQHTFTKRRRMPGGLKRHSVTCTGATVQARLQPHRQRAAALSQENRQRNAARQQPQQQPGLFTNLNMG